MFTSSFHPARSALRSVLPARSHARTGAELGVSTSESERSSLLLAISEGFQKLETVRKWIASRIDFDPLLLTTFGQRHIADNFWGYDELVVKDQYYVNQAQDALGDDVGPWDLSEEVTSRTYEWGAAIDIMYDAMTKYGRTPLTTQNGSPIQSTVAPQTTAGGGTAGGGGIKAGSNIDNEPPSAGIPIKDVLIYSGIGVVAVAAVLLVKRYT
jgi:hypothetical protein